MSNIRVRRRDVYLVRYVGDDAARSHIVHITEDNQLDEALCGLKPEGGWSRRGGTLTIRETTCEACNAMAREIGVLG